MGYTHSRPLIPASYHIAGGPTQLMGVGISHWLAAYPPAHCKPGPWGVLQPCSMPTGPSWLFSSNLCLNRSPNNSIHYV